MTVSSGKSAATSSRSVGFGVAQLDPVPTGQARTDSGLSGVEQRRHAQVAYALIQWIERAVVRLEGLHARVELEPADTVLGDESPCLFHRSQALERVDGPEGDEHVVVAGRTFGDFLAGDRQPAGGGAPRRR